jgi:protein MAK11
MSSSAMAKRKRDTSDAAASKAVKSKKAEIASAPKQPATTEVAIRPSKSKEGAKTTASKSQPTPVTEKENADAVPDTTTIQVITGSYERVLHGFAATIPTNLVTGPDSASAPETKMDFTDTFLFNAHASSIRCLAVSPLSNETSKVTLATGSTDERINLYSISTAPPSKHNKPTLPSLHGASITENPKNKELGSLLHHSSNITALHFPTRAKLLSAAEDSTIAITRTRDWTALSTIKAPIPKPQGRPSGDTAGPGEVPSGVNDFAVHPSMKLMLSVGRGEKCMRLWNLVTGKKAGVLNFDRQILSAVGEGRFGSGEGRRVLWDPEGEEFAVAFERGVVVFNIESKPKCKVSPLPRTKVHQMHYLPAEGHGNTLLVATEDGRVLVYDTSSNETTETKDDDIPAARLIAQIGGPAAGITARVKDFEIVPLSATSFLIVTGSSDGTVRFWALDVAELKSDDAGQAKGFTALQVGRLLGLYTTGTRITCLKAFPMTGTPDEEEEEEVLKKDGDDSSEDEEDSE